MNRYLRIPTMLLSLFFGEAAFAQCAPVDCLSSLPPIGGLCTADFTEGRVNAPYEDAISFHVTSACSPASVFDPTQTTASIRITQLGDITFTNLPAGVTGSTNEINYTPPANGCGALLGTPTEAGVFGVTVNLLANVNAWPFALTCSGLGPIPQNGQQITEVRELTILPDASFAGLEAGTYCITDGALALAPTGTLGGSFSGPGVVGGEFQPATAGLGSHTITYTVTAQEGAAIAPATDSFSIVVEVNDGCLLICDADAGTLSGGGTVCFEDDNAILTATANGNAVEPAGFSTLYVLTEGADLVIIAAAATPEFTVDAEGDYTIHTLVYDPNTLDISIVEFGVTTGFDVNDLLIQGGGSICASLDVTGAAFAVEVCGPACAAEAGTLTGGGVACFEFASAQLSAVADGNMVVPPGFDFLYVLTTGADLVILDGSNSPDFTVDALGVYTIHTLVYDGNTLDLNAIEVGVTTSAELEALLIQGGGSVCGSWDVAGAAFSAEVCLPACDAEAGTITGGGTVCFEGTSVQIVASADGNAVVPTGFDLFYVLTTGPDLVILDGNSTPDFNVDATGAYTIHTLVYDPNTLDLGSIVVGVTTGFEVNDLLIQGGGSICASLDVVGAAFTVQLCCDASAGTLSGGGVACFEGGSATLTATADGNAVVLDGFSTLYVLTEGADLVIIDAAATPEFTVDAQGDYTVHTLVYDPNTLDINIVEFGVTTGFEVNDLLIQGGGSICASLDVAGAAFTVQLCCDASAGTLSGGGVACLVDGAAALTATADGNAVVLDGFSTLYVLTEGADLVIIDAAATPEFTVDALGDYTIHTLVYDPSTLDISTVELGVTTGFEVNALLIQGGGTICASLDVAGAAFTVEECVVYCEAGANSQSFEKISNVTFANINNTSTATVGFEDFTAVVGDVARNTEYDITVTLNGAFAADEVLVWIDYDQNAEFTEDELVYTSDLGVGPHTGTISIPVDAALGSTRMRVRMHDSGSTGANNTPCGNSSYGQVEDYTLNIVEELPPCDALAGTLTASEVGCLEPGTVLTLTATADGNAVVPADYSTVYVLTQGAGLVIISAGAAPEFDVDAQGSYTIHTLVYDPNTLDISSVEFGVTTGFDVNGLLQQGGGLICGSLDVAGASFQVVFCCDAAAGTLSGGGAVCLENDEATLSATPNGDDTVPADFTTVYVLTEGAGLVIIDAAAAPEFVVEAAGIYTIHTLVYDPNTLDITTVELGVTTGFDVNSLLIQGGGDICASLDVTGAAFEVVVCGVYCDAGASSESFEKISNVTFADINNSSTATLGYEDFTAVVGNVARNSEYDITVTLSGGYDSDEVLVWIDYDQNSVFTANELVYTSELGEGPHSGQITIPVDAPLGTTRMRIRMHDSSLGGNSTPCGNSSYGQVEDYTLNITEELPPCDALAGTLTAGEVDCLVSGASVTLTATADGNAVEPADFSTVYVLTEGAGLVIINTAATPEFSVDAAGTYTIHTLVYDPSTLDLSIVVPGVTTGFDVNNLLIQGGGSICASLDVAGAAFTVAECVVTCDANAGTLSGGGLVCFVEGSATLTATATGNAVVPAGYSTVFVLTEGAGLVITNTAATPVFTVDAEGTYTVHTLVYDPTTLDLSIVVPGVTTGFDVNALLIQGGGSICGSLDVAGAAFSVEVCSGIESFNLADAFSIYPNPTNGDFSISSAVDANVVLELMDATGRVVYTQQQWFGTNAAAQVALGGRLTPGLYVVRMSSDLGRVEQRIVVQ